MKRANLKQEFHGEPDMAEEGAAVSGLGPDEVTIDIKGGTLTLRAPSDAPDDRVLDKDYLEQHLQLVPTDGANRLDGTRLHVLDRLGDNLGNETDRAHAHRQHPGERAQADRGDENQAPDNLVNRARKRHQEAAH